jgi:hypothetical protein
VPFRRNGTSSIRGLLGGVRLHLSGFPCKTLPTEERLTLCNDQFHNFHSTQNITFMITSRGKKRDGHVARMGHEVKKSIYDVIAVNIATLFLGFNGLCTCRQMLRHRTKCLNGRGKGVRTEGV